MDEDANDFERKHQRGFLEAHGFLNLDQRVRRTRAPTNGHLSCDDRDEPHRRGDEASRGQGLAQGRGSATEEVVGHHLASGIFIR